MAQVTDYSVVREGGAFHRAIEDNASNDLAHDTFQLTNSEEVQSEKDSKISVSLSPDRGKFRPSSMLQEAGNSRLRERSLWRLLARSYKARQWRYVNGIVAISSLGSFIWGYSFSVIGGAMLFIDDQFNLSVFWHETIVTMLVVGATIGAAIAGTLNDKFGRWKVMLTSAILHIVAATIMALAFSEIFLVIGRAIAGLALGMLLSRMYLLSSVHIHIDLSHKCIGIS